VLSNLSEFLEEFPLMFQVGRCHHAKREGRTASISDGPDSVYKNSKKKHCKIMIAFKINMLQLSCSQNVHEK